MYTENLTARLYSSFLNLLLLSMKTITKPEWKLTLSNLDFRKKKNKTNKRKLAAKILDSYVYPAGGENSLTYVR